MKPIITRPNITRDGLPPARLAPEAVTPFDEPPPPSPPQGPSFTGPPARRPVAADDAERRFWARYGTSLGLPAGAKPATYEQWLVVATAVRDLLKLEEQVKALKVRG